jgi:methyl-accepting chemotaxis protein
MQASLKVKIILLPIIAALLPVVVVIALTAYQRGNVDQQVGAELDILARENISRISLDVYEMCRAADAIMTQMGVVDEAQRAEMITEVGQAIMNIQVGKSGYVFVLGGEGDDKGNYLISKDGTRDGENIWDAKDSDGNLFIQSMVKKAVALRAGKFDFQQYPWKNAGDDVARSKIAALTYYAPWDWVIGAGTYEDDYYAARNNVDDALGSLVAWIMSGGLIILVLAALVAITLGNQIATPVRQVIEVLKKISTHLGMASEQVAVASQDMAEGASEQASGLEETSSSLEEMSSMAKQNADNSKNADGLAKESRTSAEKGSEGMARMSDAILRIRDSSAETAKTLKVIDEIAFQTNLLALNAAVEAARAGEAGKGFAVVAEEVRSLAQRCAEAAGNVNGIIETSQKDAESGVKISEEVVAIFTDITGGVEKMSTLVSEISAASQEQAQGVEQVNSAVAQMDQVTQRNASNSEECAAASHELKTQSDEMEVSVLQLVELVEGQGAGNKPQAVQPQPNSQFEQEARREMLAQSTKTQIPTVHESSWM